ncbi:hypothetical protein ES703_21660 [subsurface metagenome]|nr:hypothetical protein [bacterium]
MHCPQIPESILAVVIEMKAVLISRFKNHNAGEILDVSHRIYAYLLKLGCVADPRPLEFTPEVKEAAEELKKKKPSRKKSKALDKPPADKMVREAETK